MSTLKIRLTEGESNSETTADRSSARQKKRCMSGGQFVTLARCCFGFFFFFCTNRFLDRCRSRSEYKYCSCRRFFLHWWWVVDSSSLELEKWRSPHSPQPTRGDNCNPQYPPLRAATPAHQPYQNPLSTPETAREQGGRQKSLPRLEGRACESRWIAPAPEHACASASVPPPPPPGTRQQAWPWARWRRGSQGPRRH